VTSTGLQINPGFAAVAVTDTGSGEAAARLGILTLTPTSSTIVGAPLTARVTRLTPIADLAGGAGIDITGGLIITNGGRTANVDLSTAVTVQDIINTINNAGVSVRAQVNAAGTGIDVFNQVSGSSLFIGENGGTTATDLGIRTFDTATPLDSLNFGNGVATADGQADLQIIAKDGSTVDVNLDSAQTVGDVITLINTAATAAGVSITASFATVGNGIRIQDSTGGAGNLQVAPLNLSTTAMQLGLQQSVSGTEIIGADVNPTRTEGILGALIDLEAALRADDTQKISAAAGRIDGLRADVIRIHGIIGARSQALTSKRQQLEDAAATGRIFLSEIQDLDYAEAVTQMQQAMVRLQANMQTSSITMNLSLMDFLQ
jgi:flagellar hook-associated protein 3 FlgL